MDRNGRYAILKVHTRKLNISEDLDLERVALITPGTSGADLSAIVNEGEYSHINTTYIQYIHTYIHTYNHTYIHTYIHTIIHTY